MKMQPPGIERGQRGRAERHDVAVERRRVCWPQGRLDDGVLGEVAGERAGSPVSASVPITIIT